MSIDKVVIQGAELTRVAGRYLLQSEVEEAMSRLSEPVPQIDVLTNLLEDIVNVADRVTLEILQTSPLGTGGASTVARSESPALEARAALTRIKEELKRQIELIDGHLVGSGV